jgi:hypothetical protein
MGGCQPVGAGVGLQKGAVQIAVVAHQSSLAEQVGEGLAEAVKRLPPHPFQEVGDDGVVEDRLIQR